MPLDLKGYTRTCLILVISTHYEAITVANIQCNHIQYLIPIKCFKLF
jgi:hypothetical protein